MAETAKTTPRYAANTVVTLESTLNAVKKLLQKYGATRTGFIENESHTVIGFRIPLERDAQGPQDIGEFIVYVPHPDETQFSKTKPATLAKGGAGQTAAKIKERFANEYEHEQARLMRVVLILLTSKLAAIDGGVTSIEKEFGMDTVVTDQNGNRTTVYQWIAPQLAELRRTGKAPSALPAYITDHPKTILGRD